MAAAPTLRVRNVRRGVWWLCWQIWPLVAVGAGEPRGSRAGGDKKRQAPGAVRWWLVPGAAGHGQPAGGEHGRPFEGRGRTGAPRSATPQKDARAASDRADGAGGASAQRDTAGAGFGEETSPRIEEAISAPAGARARREAADRCRPSESVRTGAGVRAALRPGVSARPGPGRRAGAVTDRVGVTATTERSRGVRAATPGRRAKWTVRRRRGDRPWTARKTGHGDPTMVVLPGQRRPAGHGGDARSTVAPVVCRRPARAGRGRDRRGRSSPGRQDRHGQALAAEAPAGLREETPAGTREETPAGTREETTVVAGGGHGGT